MGSSEVAFCWVSVVELCRSQLRSGCLRLFGMVVLLLVDQNRSYSVKLIDQSRECSEVLLNLSRK